MPKVKSSLPTLLRRHNTLQRLAQPTSLWLASFNAAMATAPDLSNKTSPPWYAAYPAPRHLQPGCVTREELLWMLKGGENVAGRDFLLVDLRRADYEVRFLRVWSIPTLYRLFKAAGVRKVIWYCSSSRGRGTRAAGWFQDHIVDCGGGDSMESLILHEGVKGWALGGYKRSQQLLVTSTFHPKPTLRDRGPSTDTRREKRNRSILATIGIPAISYTAATSQYLNGFGLAIECAHEYQMPRKFKTPDSSAQNRESQRRSRARRRELINSLSRQLEEYKRRGVQASLDMQRAARAVFDENQRLRALLTLCGVSPSDVSQYLSSFPSPGYARMPDARVALSRVHLPATAQNSSSLMPRHITPIAATRRKAPAMASAAGLPAQALSPSGSTSGLDEAQPQRQAEGEDYCQRPGYEDHQNLEQVGHFMDGWSYGNA
ncbi:hypothetical protein Purlil1_14168 [Purpureocillium lilacinum]|uniref:Rhodanese domain-containing protein n=1 Tax=Purpureocillium lilacinum TaxID=33203 RepID=A0ABR0BC26_PURLI|nr:hypothetical protein Purlil1_14168 [Purpureocillium lilacinum]